MISLPTIDFGDGLLHCVASAQTLAYRRIGDSMFLGERRGGLAGRITRAFPSINSLDCRLGVLPEMQPANNRWKRHARQARKVCRRCPLAVAQNRHVVPSVAFLRLIGRPTTVARFVVSVSIDAIKSVARWTRSHVSNERGKITGPSTTECDSAPAVVLVALRRWSAASIGSVHPRLIFARVQTSETSHIERIDYTADQLLQREK